MPLVFAILLSVTTDPASQPTEAPAPALDAEPARSEDVFSIFEEQNVVTSSRHEERQDFAPNTVYVITKEQIRLYGYHTLMDLLRVIPGFAVFHKDIELTAQVRGIAPNDNEKIAWLLNGSNISQTAPSMLNGPIDLSIAERVEIIVGPGSVLYGADSVLATVNIITKKVEHSELTAAGGNVTGEGTAIVGGKLSDSRFVSATATAMGKNGWDAWSNVDHGGPGQPNLAGVTTTGRIDPSFFLSINGRFDDWTVQASSRNLQFPDLKHAVSDPPGVSGTRYERNNNIEMRNDHTWLPGLSTAVDLSYADKRQIRAFTGTNYAAQGESTYDLWQGTYRGDVSVQDQYRWNFFQAGVQVRADQNSNNYILNWAPQDPTVPPGPSNQVQQFVKNENTYGLGIYASDEVEPWGKQAWGDLKAVAALRLDKNTMLGFDHNYFSPRASIIYQFGIWTTKLIYNTATRVPAPWEGPLNEVWGIGAPGAPAFATVNTTATRPEVLQAGEWTNVFKFGFTRASLNVYYQHMQDFIAWGGPFTNVGNLDGEGAELDVRTSPTQRLTIWGNATFQNTIFKVSAAGTSFGNVPANPKGEMAAAPKFIANAGANWEFLPHFFISPTLRYFTLQPTFFWPTNSWGYTNDRFYVDATISATDVGVKGLDLALQGTNLTNNTFTVSAQYLQGRYRERGIEGMLQATYRFQ